VKKRLKELAQALQAGKSSEPLEEDVKGEEEEN
jgi:hypothetical protein